MRRLTDDVYEALDNDEFELYDSIEETPVDDVEEGEDGDDSKLKGQDPSLGSGLPPTGRPVSGGAPRPHAPRRRIVPFARPLHRGKRGEDVKAVQRALRFAQRKKLIAVRPGLTGIWGPLTTRALRQFQKRKGLTVDGQYGKASHKALAPFFDAKGLRQMAEAKRAHDAPKLTKLDRVQAKIVACAVFGYNNRNLIRYTQSSQRMYGVRNRVIPPNIPFYEDCSSFATWTYYVADRSFGNVPDPNALSYGGWGYTGTLAAHGKRAFSKVPAALGFYGSGTFSHVVIAIGDGTKVISHGSDPGPYLLDYFYRSDFARFWQTYSGVHYR